MKNTFKVKAIRRIAGIIAVVAIIGFSMAACGGGSGGDDNKNGGTTPTGGAKTIRITDVPSTWAGTIGVYIFSEFKTGGRPDYAAGDVYAFSGGVIIADLSPFTGSGEYYVTIQPSNSTSDGYVYFGSGSSPVKVNIKEALTTLSFNQFKQYNIWR